MTRGLNPVAEAVSNLAYKRRDSNPFLSAAAIALPAFVTRVSVVVAPVAAWGWRGVPISFLGWLGLALMENTGKTFAQEVQS